MVAGERRDVRPVGDDGRGVAVDGGHERARREVGRGPQLGPERAPQDERHARAAGAEPGRGQRGAPGGPGDDGAVAAAGGERVDRARRDVAVRHAGVGDAGRGVVDAAAEQCELDRRAGMERRERAGAVGRHAVGDEQDGPAGHRSASSYARTVAAPQRSQVNAASTVARADCAERAQRGAVGEQPVDRPRERGGVAGGDEPDAVAGPRDLLRARLPGAADRGQPAGHRLDVRDAERLVHARQDEHPALPRAPERLRVRELPGELDAPGEAELAGQALERRPLGAVADHPQAQRGVAVAQQRHRAQHVGVALAGDEVGDGHEQVLVARPGGRREVGPEVHDARPARAEGAAGRLDPRAVGEHEPRRAERPGHRRAAGRVVGRGVEDVAAVDGDDERRGDPGAQHRVARGHRVVGVDEVEREAPPQAPQRDRERRRRPGAPGPVRPRARGRDEAHVLDLEAVEHRAARLAQEAPGRGEKLARRRRERRDRAVEDEHPHVGAGVARGERLAVGPDAEDGVGGAGVVLRDDRDLHRCTCTVRTSSRRTYGRSARNARASAIAASCP